MTAKEGSVAVVTGAASGIGAAIVQLLLKEGVKVLAADLHTEALSDLAASSAGAVAAVRTDITDRQSVSDAIGTAVDRFGRIDQLFNVAGGAKFGAILDGQITDWTDTVALGLTGTYLMTRFTAEVMRGNRDGGSIVNVSSLNAHVPLFGGSSYSAAKAGTENFTKSAALELARHKIRVNAVLPGLVNTPLVENMLANDALERDFLSRIPLGVPASAEQIARPCLFLAGDGAAYITGTSLVVDGGWEISNYPDMQHY
ncbi:SDR family oxidoreductase [Rhodococcus fascians]|nr:SDR family oxidoreductase [Rhodococcus fascians]MBY3999466.1 SDR family oxidoreductase [Rhodococcus fascians]MBY4004999.1 SDR family oxidoreductase [Rhodococcus fascians]MBY4010128.1 SDR family oxidoreductase [Rhodococcus fascians]MBY4020206.1 SDR family oxidoreductase [Rhodococcus fascians]